MKKAFYGALFCDPTKPSDTLVEGERIEGWDYILFTNLDIKSKYWQIRKIVSPHGPNVVSAKAIKWHSNVYLPEYDVVYWMDACCTFLPENRESLEALVENLKTASLPLYINKHPARKCVYDEVDATLKFNKIAPPMAKNVRNWLDEISMPRNYGLFETKNMLKLHRHPLVQQISRAVFKKIKDLTYRDQLVLTPILFQLSIPSSAVSQLAEMSVKKGITRHSYSKDEPRSVAICFWGITRSLKYTFSSIHRNLFKVLKDANIKYDIYLHTYTVTEPYTNKRASEFNLILDNDEYKWLNPKVCMVEQQSEVDKRLGFEAYRTKGDPWEKDRTDFATLNNHIRSLWSLKQVTNLWLPYKNDYTHIMYCRPDVEYLKPLDVRWFDLLSSAVAMPNFSLHTDVNDRFLIAKPMQALVYGNRFDGALEYSKENPLHSEKYLAHILMAAEIRWKHLNFIFNRVRANGEVEKADLNKK